MWVLRLFGKSARNPLHEASSSFTITEHPMAVVPDDFEFSPNVEIPGNGEFISEFDNASNRDESNGDPRLSGDFVIFSDDLRSSTRWSRESALLSPPPSAPRSMKAKQHMTDSTAEEDPNIVNSSTARTSTTTRSASHGSLKRSSRRYTDHIEQQHSGGESDGSQGSLRRRISGSLVRHSSSKSRLQRFKDKANQVNALPSSVS